MAATCACLHGKWKPVRELARASPLQVKASSASLVGLLHTQTMLSILQVSPPPSGPLPPGRPVSKGGRDTRAFTCMDTSTGGAPGTRRGCRGRAGGSTGGRGLGSATVGLIAFACRRLRWGTNTPGFGSTQEMRNGRWISARGRKLRG